MSIVDLSALQCYNTHYNMNHYIEKGEGMFYLRKKVKKEEIEKQRTMEISRMYFSRMRKNSPTYINQSDTLRNIELLAICNHLDKKPNDNAVEENGQLKDVLEDMKNYLVPMQQAISGVWDMTVENVYPCDVSEMMRPASAAQIQYAVNASIACAEGDCMKAFFLLKECISDKGYAVSRNKIISINECGIYMAIIQGILRRMEMRKTE